MWFTEMKVDTPHHHSAALLRGYPRPAPSLHDTIEDIQSLMEDMHKGGGSGAQGAAGSTTPNQTAFGGNGKTPTPHSAHTNGPLPPKRNPPASLGLQIFSDTYRYL